LNRIVSEMILFGAKKLTREQEKEVMNIGGIKINSSSGCFVSFVNDKEVNENF